MKKKEHTKLYVVENDLGAAATFIFLMQRDDGERALLIDWFLADSLFHVQQVIHSEEGGNIHKYISE